MRTAFLSLAVAIVLAACGYKAPLYLPKPKPEPAVQKPGPATSPAPAAPAAKDPEDSTRR